MREKERETHTDKVEDRQIDKKSKTLRHTEKDGDKASEMDRDI